MADRIIEKNVKELGLYAFRHSYIDTLKLPMMNLGASYAGIVLLLTNRYSTKFRLLYKID
jgi:hypothetical protein